MSTLLGDARIRVRPDFDNFGRDTDRTMGVVAKRAAGIFVTAFAGIAVGGFLKDAISAASDLNETVSKTQAVFGTASKGVEKFAARGATQLGQTRTAVLDAASTFGTFGRAAGLAGKDNAKFSTALTTLATDLASFGNSTVEEAVESLSSGLRGEADPLEKYGILLNDAALRNRALKLGLISTTKDALSPQNKVLAANAEIMAQTVVQQGDFARTSGGLANQTRILGAQFATLRTNIGAGLEPAVAYLANRLSSSLLPSMLRVSENSDQVALGLRGMALAFRDGDVTSDGFVGGMERAGNAARGLYELIANGDYTRALRLGFGLEEDSPVVDFLLALRETVVDLGAQFRSALAPAAAAFRELAAPVAQLLPQIVATALAFSPLLLVVRSLTPVMPVLAGALASVAAALAGLVVQVLPALLSLVEALAGPLAAALTLLAPLLVQVVAALANGLVAALQVVVAVLGPVLVQVIQFTEFLAPLILAVGAVWLGFQLWAGIAAIVTAVSTAMAVAATVINGVKFAMIALNFAIAANPLGALITAITAAIAVLVYFLTQTETGQKIVAAAWAGIKAAVGAVVTWFQRTVVPALTLAWDEIKRGAQVMVDGIMVAVDFFVDIWRESVALVKQIWETVLAPVFSAISAGFRAVVDFIKLSWDTVGSPVFQLIAAMAKWLWEVVLAVIFIAIRKGWELMVLGIQLYWNTILKPVFEAVAALVELLVNTVIVPAFRFFEAQWQKTVDGIKFVWLNVLKPALDAIAQKWNDVVSAVTLIWNTVLSPMFTAVGDKVTSLYRGAVTESFDGINRSWGMLTASIELVWNTVLKPVFDGLASILTNKVAPAFSTGVTAIGVAWDALKAKAKEPVKFVIEKVLNEGIIGTFNKVADFFNTDKIPKVPLPQGFATGGYTGNGGKYEPKGIVHGGEYVATKAETSRIGPSNIRRFLDTAGRGVKGYAGGGLVDFGRKLERAGALVGEHPAFGNGRVGKHSKNSAHYSGNAIDVNYDGHRQSEKSFLRPWGLAAHKAGYQVFFNVPGLPQWPGHDDHLHVANKKGGAGGFVGAIGSALGSAANALSDPASLLRGVIDKQLKGIGDSMPAKLATGMVRKVGGLAIDKASSLASSVTDLFHDGAGERSEVPGGSGVARWEPTILRALARVGEPASLLPKVLRRMNQESGGNPRAINLWDSNAKKGIPSKGLLQTIDPTFQRWRDRALANDVYDPFANIVASLRYAKAQYGSVARGYDRAGGYRRGTASATKGLHWVGEEGPELLQFAGGERVTPARQSRDMAKAAASPTTGATHVGPLVGEVHMHDRTDPALFINALDNQLRTRGLGIARF